MNILRKFRIPLIALALLMLMELIVRQLGIAPVLFGKEDAVHSDPEPMFANDGEAGFVMLPGEYSVDAHHKLRSNVVHLDDLSRYTGEAESDTGMIIHIYGCSFTYGFLLNDSSTMPFQLQALMPDAIVKNYGVPGYGLTQMSLLFKKNVDEGRRPDIAIFNYASFQDTRNVCSKLHMAIMMQFHGEKWEELQTVIPCCTVSDGDLEFNYLNVHEHRIKREPRLALLRLVRNYRMLRELKKLPTKEVSRLLIDEIAAYSAQEDIELIVAGLKPDAVTSDFLNYCEGTGIETADIELDISDTTYNLYPIDIAHPNGLANSIYAEKLHDYLEQSLEQH